MAERHAGQVRAFDEARGIGEITTADGRVVAFHCALIADGSRRIDVGAMVGFETVGGHRGRWEARDIHLL